MDSKRTRKTQKEERARERRAKKKPGREFEEAVFNFVKAHADKDAEVIFDHKQLSVFTGKPRQVDAWIRMKVLGHVPISIAVSCKDHGRRLDDTHIEDFHARVRSYGASTGIIYARRGFYPGAVELAKKFGIACCQLWKDRPADVPGLKLMRHYWCCPELVVPILVQIGDSEFKPKTWDELFDHRAAVGGKTTTVLEHIREQFRWGAQQSSDAQKGSPEVVFPEPWQVAFSLDDSLERPTLITIRGLWRKFRGRVEASLLTGSYCEINKQFQGQQKGPPMVVEGFPSPPEWEQIHDNPAPDGAASILLTAIRTGGLNEGLRERLRGQPLPA